MQRRSFIKQSGLAAAGIQIGRFIPVAGPFFPEDFSGPAAPTDKKLKAAWVRSLYERGTATTYAKSRNELRYIGMPVGGICCGSVYLGGDGQLWLWDIFNQNQLGAVTKTLPIKLETFNVTEINNVFGSLYLDPATGVRPLRQGFALSIQHNGSTLVKRLHQDDWDEILFEATYPVATIKYIDKNLPLDITLQAFSPFIPGDALHSGLPATIQSITIRNRSAGQITVQVTGWLENKMLLYTEKKQPDFKRENDFITNAFCKGLGLACHTKNPEIEKAADFGNMSFVSMDPGAVCVPDAMSGNNKLPPGLENFIGPSAGSPVALISNSRVIKPGKTFSTDFIISWYTPNISFPNSGPKPEMTVQDSDYHFYTGHFSNATDVALYIARQYTSLKQQTLLWNKTWYDSTLPWWFLERTLMNISTLATTTSHRFKSGRFYAWEGIGCCEGTCTHVYQYAQAMSRIFPALERDTRERVDLGISYDEPTGMIRYRGEKSGPSIDGQAGTVLRIYREYLMSEDGSLLKNHWGRIKKAVEFVMKQDKNGDGMEDTPMENTLDAQWSGEISWIVGLCIASVRAGEKMAEEMHDGEFAALCSNYVEKGRKNMEQYLFNGEYFIHRPDPSMGKKEVGSYNTCHIDQVYGQSWAWQVGLGRILNKEKTMSALRALWKYNYMPDVGPYIKEHPGGRFYALAGEGGMVMNTNPRQDEKPYGEAKAWQIGYFSECMSGFEYQVAAHMMAEGMVDESLVLIKTIHDRYHAFKRNPFNEIECSDHYGRAMAGYGAFLNACGFTYHGPRGHIGFAPKIKPENFKAPFTAAAGWGSFTQQRDEKKFSAGLHLQYGKLQLSRLDLDLDQRQKASQVTLTLGSQSIPCHFTQVGSQIEISLPGTLVVKKGQLLAIKITG